MSDQGTDAYAALRACKLWGAASDEAVARLTEHAKVRSVPRGTMLAEEGEPADRFGVMMQGRARVFHLGADGRTITFESVDRGDPLAAVAALAGGRYPASIETTTPATIVWLPRNVLFDLIESEPKVARNLIANLASRVVHFTQVVQSLSMDVPSRLARYLFQRSLAVGKTTSAGLVVDLGMTKAELASALGTVPETLSRAFAKLRDEGLLEVRSSDVIVLDVGGLARLGAGYED